MQLERLARTYWRFLSRVDARADPRRLQRGAAHRRAAAPAAAAAALQGAGVRDGRAARHRPLADRGRPAGRSGAATTATATCRSTCSGCRRRATDVRASASRSRSRTSIRRSRSGFGRPVYRVTQSRIHVLVTYGFLRSLARLDLAESRVGRFARDLRRRRAGPAARLSGTGALGGAGDSAVAAAGDRAQLRAVVARMDAAHGAGARAHHERFGRRAARRGSARPAARRRR